MSHIKHNTLKMQLEVRHNSTWCCLTLKKTHLKNRQLGRKINLYHENRPLLNKVAVTLNNPATIFRMKPFNREKQTVPNKCSLTYDKIPLKSQNSILKPIDLISLKSDTTLFCRV